VSDPDLHLPGNRPKRALHIQADTTGQGYIRALLPAAAINWQPELGWHVACQGNIPTNAIDAADFVLGQRIASQSGWELWQYANRPGGPATAFETDDLLSAIPRTHPAADFYLSPETQQIINDAIRIADALIVSTDPLVDELRHLNSNAYVIPNHVNEEFIRPEPRDPGENGKVIIGWTGGNDRQRDLKPYSQIVSKVLRKYRDTVALNLMGMDYRSLFEGDVRYTPWVPDVEDYLLSLEFDIGVCFLVENRFNRCKSPLKALDYAGQGIPVLAPAITPYKEYVEHGEWGLLYRNEDELRSHLLDLIHDPDRRYEMGRKGIAFAHTQSEQACCHERVAIYEKILASR
jgi:glycosyltransferase involved in cell wall biosynthesis